MFVIKPRYYIKTFISYSKKYFLHKQMHFYITCFLYETFIIKTEGPFLEDETKMFVKQMITLLKTLYDREDQDDEST